MRVPPLTTARLVVRPFVLDDLAAIHAILDLEPTAVDGSDEDAMSLDERRGWLTWTTLGYEYLARLHQPPYGDRAVALRASGEVIGAVGYVPLLDQFGRLPSLATPGSDGSAALSSTELGIYYAISPRHRRRGYATEAARALIAYAFEELQLARIVATTSDDNEGSIAVMRRLGMRLERNPGPEPPWLQVVGVLTNPSGIA